MRDSTNILIGNYLGEKRYSTKLESYMNSLFQPKSIGSVQSKGTQTNQIRSPKKGGAREEKNKKIKKMD